MIGLFLVINVITIVIVLVVVRWVSGKNNLMYREITAATLKNVLQPLYLIISALMMMCIIRL